jgi:hypothetical protein
MTIRISLPPDAEARLHAKAEAVGQDVTSYATQLLSEALTAPSVDELLAPFRRQVEESGISDQELDEFYEDLRDKVTQERNQAGAE